MLSVWRAENLDSPRMFCKVPQASVEGREGGAAEEGGATV